MLRMILGVLFAGCAGMPVSAVLKSPVQEQCTQTGLKGCPELVEGVLLYAGGNEQAAQKKLDEAIAQNSTEDARADAGAAGAHARAKTEDNTASSGMAVATAVQPTPVREEPVEPVFVTAQRNRAEVLLYSVSAASDPMRMVSESSSPAAPPLGSPCLSGDMTATCSKLRAGPLIVTDIVALSGCPDALFLVSGPYPPSGVSWLVEAQPTTAITGARLAVRGNEWLYVAVRPRGKELSRDPRWVVAWSGFTPRIVPQ